MPRSPVNLAKNSTVRSADLMEPSAYGNRRIGSDKVSDAEVPVYFWLEL